LKEQDEEEAPFIPPALIHPKYSSRLPRIIATVLIAAVLIYGGSRLWQHWSRHSESSTVAQTEPLAVQTVGDLTLRSSAICGARKAISARIP